MYFPLIAFLNGEITLGSVVFIYTVYGNLVGPLFGFVHAIRGYYRAMIDFEALFQYGEIENEIKDKPFAPRLDIRKGEIEFKNIDFRYHKNKIFNDFNLEFFSNAFSILARVSPGPACLGVYVA